MTTLAIAERNRMRTLLQGHNINARTMSDAEIVAKYDELTTGNDEPPRQLAAKPARILQETPRHEDTRIIPTGALPARIDAPKLDEQPRNDAEKMAKIAALIESLTPAAPAAPQAPAFNEAQLIDLIKQYATKTLRLDNIESRDIVEIEGAHAMLETLVICLHANTMPYCCGPAGSGKTTLAMQAAAALDLPFYSSGAISAPYEVCGMFDANGIYKSTALREAFENGGVFLFDEIDSCSARALVAINQLLANGRFQFPDKMVTKHKNFRAIGAANTIGKGATRQYAGRNPLDGATLDRFIMLDIDYDEALEYRVALAEYEAHGGDKVNDLSLWCLRVLSARKAAATLKIDALITPRASMFGARLLAGGLSFDMLDKMVLFKGLSVDAVKQIKGAI